MLIILSILVLVFHPLVQVMVRCVRWNFIQGGPWILKDSLLNLIHQVVHVLLWVVNIWLVVCWEAILVPNLTIIANENV